MFYVQELFLYKAEEEEDKAQDSSAGSRMNDRAHSSSYSNSYSGTSSSSSRGHHTPAPALTTASAQRNKQFKAYQTILSGNIGRYGDAYTVSRAGTGNAICALRNSECWMQ